MKKKTLAICLATVLYAADLHAACADYTFSCWLNGWRKNGNDPSADYDERTNSYAITFNLPLDGLEESTWSLTNASALGDSQ